MYTCPQCGSNNIRKNGTSRGTARLQCKDCKHTFAQNPIRKSKAIKAQALLMYLNNVGIRKIALFLQVSPTAVLKWIKQAHKILQEQLQTINPLKTNQTDIIELDEIYTYVKKRKIECSYGLLILGGKNVLLHLSPAKD